MRKISKEIAESFYKGFSKSKGNTATDGVNVWLHGNKIAWRTQDNNLEVTLAGWPTVTTRERLNAILEIFDIQYRISQRDHDQIIRRVVSYDNGFKDQYEPIGENWIINFFDDDHQGTSNGYKFRNF